MQQHLRREDDRDSNTPVDGRSAIRAVTDTYTDLAVWLYSKTRFLILRQSFLDEI